LLNKYKKNKNFNKTTVKTFEISNSPVRSAKFIARK